MYVWVFSYVLCVLYKLPRNMRNSHATEQDAEKNNKK